ncbi:MAG: hypothetical protein FWG70_05840 [Oscillospiraceae bacterium]|nr:hypothetical protein [Oscillospiraceae bacterium]
MKYVLSAGLCVIIAGVMLAGCGGKAEKDIEPNIQEQGLNESQIEDKDIHEEKPIEGDLIFQNENLNISEFRYIDYETPLGRPSPEDPFKKTINVIFPLSIFDDLDEDIALNEAIYLADKSIEFLVGLEHSYDETIKQIKDNFHLHSENSLKYIEDFHKNSTLDLILQLNIFKGGYFSDASIIYDFIKSNDIKADYISVVVYALYNDMDTKSETSLGFLRFEDGSYELFGMMF